MTVAINGHLRTLACPANALWTLVKKSKNAV
jgi:hypothetical protein